MSHPIDAKPVKAWLSGIGNHDFFPLLLEGIRLHNRMSGWEQTSEWMEMKANGYRAGFEEAVKTLENLVNESYIAVPTEPTDGADPIDPFAQHPEIADHVSSRFQNE